jgi:hypothetical protein
MMIVFRGFLLFL